MLDRGKIVTRRRDILAEGAVDRRRSVDTDSLLMSEIGVDRLRQLHN